MKSLRLTRDMRDSIMKNVREAWQRANPEPTRISVALKQELIDIARKQARKVSDDIASLAGEETLPYLNRTTTLRIRLPGAGTQSVKMSAADDPQDFAYCKYGTGAYLADANSITKESSDAVKKFAKRYAETEPQRKAEEAVHETWAANQVGYIARVRAVLDAVNSTKALLETMPGMEAFIPAEILNPELIVLPERT